MTFRTLQMQRRRRNSSSSSSLHPRPSRGRHSAPWSSCIIFIVIGTESCSAYFAVKLTYAQYDINSPLKVYLQCSMHYCLKCLEPPWRSPYQCIPNPKSHIFSMACNKGFVFIVPLQRKLSHPGFIRHIRLLFLMTQIFYHEGCVLPMGSQNKKFQGFRVF